MANFDEVLIRDLIRDEEEAIVGYDKAILKINDKRLVKVLEDIRNEELVHIGELKELMLQLGVDDNALIEQGHEEATEKLLEAVKELYNLF